MFLCTHMHSKLIIFLAFQQSHLHLSGDGVGRGGVITFMFLCTHRHSNLIMFLALQQTQALLFHDDLPVGWGGVITFMFLCTHGHSTLSSFLLSSRHRHYSFMMTYRWGGVGWGNNVHVPVHAHAQQAYHLSFFPAVTPPPFWGWGGEGWGNNVHVPVHTQAHTGTAT